MSDRKQQSLFTFSARESIAFGMPFAPRGEPIHDPGVALDYIRSLEAQQEDVVLRVVASGAGARRAGIDGDWLCVPGSAPRILPAASGWWTWSEEAEAWCRGREWVEAWEECRDPSWLARGALEVGVGPSVVLMASAAAIRAAAGGDPPPRTEKRLLAAEAVCAALESGDGAAVSVASREASRLSVHSAGYVGYARHQAIAEHAAEDLCHAARAAADWPGDPALASSVYSAVRGASAAASARPRRDAPDLAVEAAVRGVIGTGALLRRVSLSAELWG